MSTITAAKLPAPATAVTTLQALAGATSATSAAITGATSRNTRTMIISHPLRLVSSDVDSDSARP